MILKRVLYEKCVDCGTPKETYHKQLSQRCSSCARAKQQAERNKQYFTCIDCGKPKTTYHQQRSPRCNACSGLHKHTHEQYYTSCITCGKQYDKPKIYQRCIECGVESKRKHELFSECQKCGIKKTRNASRLCQSCYHEQRMIEHPKVDKSLPPRRKGPIPTVVTYQFCQQCGKEKAKTKSPICHHCSLSNIVKSRAFRTVYDHCQKCGKPKPKNDRELCLACAGVKRMTEMYPNTDREYPYGWSDNFREAIRARDHHLCVLCGKTEIDNHRKLHVHHTTYQKADLNPDRLVSLCTSCHNKTNWHRSYWQTFFAMRNRPHPQDWQRKVVVTSIGWSPIPWLPAGLCHFYPRFPPFSG